MCGAKVPRELVVEPHSNIHDMNPSERLLAIYDKFIENRTDVVASQVWAAVFGLDVTSTSLDDEVTDCLVALRTQIDFTRRLLEVKYSVPGELLNPGFMRLRAAAAPGVMNQSWSSLRGNVQEPACRQAFLWTGWVLRAEAEAEIPLEELTALHSELAALEEALKAAELSEYLSGFISTQIQVIKDALRLYRLQGVKPVNDALTRIAGAYTVERYRVKREVDAAQPEARGLFEKVTSFVGRTAEVCDAVEKLKTGYETASGIAAKVGTVLIPFVGKMLG